MPSPLDFTATVTEDGHLPDYRRKQISANLKHYAGEEVRVRVTKPKRSTAANAYYWGVVLPAIQLALSEVGQAVSAEALHWLFKNRYLPPRPEYVEALDETVVLPPSTAELDSTSFFEYVEAIRYDEAVLALGVEIPEPESSYRSYRITEPI